MISTVVNTLAPLVILVAVGAILRKRNFASSEFFSKCNALVFHLALPCMLFDKIAGGGKELDKAFNIFWMMLGGTLGAIALGYLFNRIMKIPAGSRGVFVQGAYRGNLAYVGLTVILFSDFHNSMETSTALSLAALAFAPLIPIYNIVSVAVLLGDNHDKSIPLKKRLTDMAVRICTNPLFIACVLGVVYSLLPLTIPLAVHRSLDAIGRISLPLALMGIGSTLIGGGIKGDLPVALANSFLKLVAAPLIGLAIAFMLGADVNEIKIAIIMLGTPTAVASFVMADQLNCNGKLASSMVIVSTLLSAVTMAVILVFTSPN